MVGPVRLLSSVESMLHDVGDQTTRGAMIACAPAGHCGARPPRIRRTATACLLLLLMAAFLPWDAAHLNGKALPQDALAASGAVENGAAKGSVLKLGESVERELAGGGVHQYVVALAPDQYVHLIVDQRGIDVAVSVLDPDSKPVAQVDSPNGAQGPEPLELVAETGGDYRIEVRAPDAQAPAGMYSVRLDELRPATQQDHKRLEAEKAFAEAERLQSQMTAESLPRAAAAYQKAVELFQVAGEDSRRANTFSKLGEVFYVLGDKRSSLEYFTKSLDLIRVIHDQAGEAECLANIGLVNSDLGEKEKALDSLNQALLLLRARGDRPGEAATMNNIGLVYWSMSEHQKALGYYTQVLTIARELKQLHGEAVTLNNIAAVYDVLGELRSALEYHKQALSLRRALKDKAGEAITLSNMGAALSSLDEKQEALEYYDQALQLLREVGDTATEAGTLNNIGEVYEDLGEPQRALDFYRQAFPRWEAAGDRHGQAVALNNTGAVYAHLGDTKMALDSYERALALTRGVHDRKEEGNVLHNIGVLHASMKDDSKALAYYEQALPLRRDSGDRAGEAATLHSTGSIYQLRKDYEKAAQYYEHALALRRDVADRSGEAETLFAIARLKHEGGDLPGARANIEQSLDLIESLRAKLKVAQLRASYFASAHQYSEFYVNLLMEMHRRDPASGHDAEALEASERARARSLLELLNEAHIDVREGVDQKLLERERALRLLLNSKAERHVRLLNGRSTPEQLSAAAKEIESLTGEYEQVQAKIREASPHYAALTQPQPLSVKGIQDEVLDENTLLLEYALGEERSYCWVVGAHSIKSYELANGREIESAAKRMYDSLIAPNQLVAGESAEARNRRIDIADAEYREAATELSRMIIGPVAAEIGRRRLLIVSDGALQYVPFGALLAPAAADAPSTPAPHPLITDHEIVHAPSASTVALLRREMGGRAPAPKLVAVLADPVFDNADPRILPGGGGEEARATRGGSPSAAEVRSSEPLAVERAVREAGVGSGGALIPRLVFTRREAQAIARLVPERRRKEALDFDASRATATSGELGDYQVVHFATHGILNSVTPELSGVILSLVDRQGRPQDGFLKLDDIYNMKMRAELVVLSACQTALGREVKGEGLVGLTRGLMYAGAERVVASLWRVDDVATAELMKKFYEAMLGPRALPPAAALRDAQISMLGSKRWESPYLWAGFVIQGEWR